MTVEAGVVQPHAKDAGRGRKDPQRERGPTPAPPNTLVVGSRQVRAPVFQPPRHQSSLRGEAAHPGNTRYCRDGSWQSERGRTQETAGTHGPATPSEPRVLRCGFPQGTGRGAAP